MEGTEKKFYQRDWFIVLMLIVFFPVGIFLMWKYTSWKKVAKIIVTVIFSLILLSAIFGDNEDNNNNEVKEPVKEKGKITFQVRTSENLGDDFECVVNVSGKEKSGEEEKDINDNYTAKLDKEYHLNYKAGTYKIKLDTSSLNTDVNIYKERELTITYDGEYKEKATLWIALDLAEMEKRQAEKEAQNQEQKPQPQPGGGQEVAKQYILVTTTGTFHLAGCSALKRAKDGNKQTIVATYSEMIARGYKPCKICL